MKLLCREVVIRRAHPDQGIRAGDRMVLPLDTCNELVAKRIARWGRPGIKPPPIRPVFKTQPRRHAGDDAPPLFTDEPDGEGEREEELDVAPSAEDKATAPETPAPEPAPATPSTPTASTTEPAPEAPTAEAPTNDAAPEAPTTDAAEPSTSEPAAPAADPSPGAPTEPPSWETVRAMAHADARELVDGLTGDGPFGWDVLEAHYTAWLAAQTEAEG